MGGRNKKENTEVFAVLPSWNDEKEERFLRQKVTVTTWKMVEKIWILSKNIFGKSLTKCAPSGHERTIINRKSREPFFKYGSLRLNDLSSGHLRHATPHTETSIFFSPSTHRTSTKLRTRLRLNVRTWLSKAYRQRLATTTSFGPNTVASPVLFPRPR